MYNQASYLIHFGILGQKWGVRRFQNEDGTLTEEGRRRYLDLTDRQTVDRVNSIVGRTTDIFNKRVLKETNKKYDKIYGKDYNLLKDHKANLEYTRDMMEGWKRTYREVLAKDLGTDPKSLEGQKWLDEMFYYKSGLDDEYKELDRKVNGRNKVNSENKKQNKEVPVKSPIKEKSVKSESRKESSKKVNLDVKPLKDYSNNKMSQSKAINQAYADLEKIYPNFSSLSLNQQDTLFYNYLDSSGLYKWM